MNRTAHRHSTGRLFITALWLLVGSGLASPAAADDPALSGDSLVWDLLEGDMRLLQLANNHGGLHLSLESPSQETGAYYSSPVSNNLANEQGVHLSYRLSWK